MRDNIRPRGTVEVECSGDKCREWASDGTRVVFWVDALDPRLPDGPFICPSCLGVEMPKADELDYILDPETPEAAVEACAREMGLDPDALRRRGEEFVRHLKSQRGAS